MKKLHKDFPIFLIKNFNPIYFSKDKIVEKVLENRELFYCEQFSYNFLIKNDYKNFFSNLYKKFYNLCKKNFSFTLSTKSIDACWSYVSDKNNFREVWHNHLNTSTINGVYYLNVPKNDNVTIDFELDNIIFTYKVNNYDLIIFPNYLNHKPNRCYKNGYRISVNMEIICNETVDYVFNNIR